MTKAIKSKSQSNLLKITNNMPISLQNYLLSLLHIDVKHQNNKIKYLVQIKVELLILNFDNKYIDNLLAMVNDNPDSTGMVAVKNKA